MMGFGHAVYRAEDPRSALLKDIALGFGGPRVEFAVAVEDAVLRLLDELKPGRALRTNVEFYAGVVMEGCGIPAADVHPDLRGRPGGRLDRARAGAGGRGQDHPSGLPLRRPTRAATGPLTPGPAGPAAGGRIR